MSAPSPEPPIIDGDVHSNRIEPLGGNAILNCEVRGDPLPIIRWSKMGISVPISNRIRQLDNGSLAIYGTVVHKHNTTVMSVVHYYRCTPANYIILFGCVSFQGHLYIDHIS